MLNVTFARSDEFEIDDAISMVYIVLCSNMQYLPLLHLDSLTSNQLIFAK